MASETVHELEVLDAIDDDADLRALVLRVARLAERGALAPFLEAVETDVELNDETRSWLLTVAHDPFLRAAKRYAGLARPAPPKPGYNPFRRAISSVG